VDDEKTNTEIWYIMVHCTGITNGDVKLIDKNKVQRLLIGFSLGCPLKEAYKRRKSLSRNL